MKKKPVPKERNPFVQHLVNKRGAGAHGKSKKASRRQDKMALKKDHCRQAIRLVA